MSFHIKPYDVRNVYMHDFEIYVDIMGQLELQRLFASRMMSEMMNFGNGIDIPIFPLNTDGIDPTGENMVFRNIKITNFDDAIVAKPGSINNRYTNCTSNILAENIDITFGVGLSIGSISPNSVGNCIKDILFRNIKFSYPLKAIYIKTNPGDEGYGMVSNITFENIVMDHPVWWGVYIGPQQMKEPSGDGPGCMVYPLQPCPTQPLISITNITLRNVTSEGGYLPAGIIRCNKTNPCTGFKFEDVTIKSFFWDTLKQGYISEYIEGETSGNVFPDPGFKPTGYYSQE